MTNIGKPLLLCHVDTWVHVVVHRPMGGGPAQPMYGWAHFTYREYINSPHNKLKPITSGLFRRAHVLRRHKRLS